MTKELTIKKEIVMTKENYDHCKRIALELDAIAEGKVFFTEDGYDTIEIEDDYYDTELEQFTLFDYFNDCFDIKYTLESDRETLSGVKIMIACGGPNIYVDTNDGKVKLFWWSDYAEYDLLPDTVRAIDDTFQELFYC